MFHRNISKNRTVLLLCFGVPGCFFATFRIISLIYSSVSEYRTVLLQYFGVSDCFIYIISEYQSVLLPSFEVSGCFVATFRNMRLFHYSNSEYPSVSFRRVGVTVCFAVLGVTVCFISTFRCIGLFCR